MANSPAPAAKFTGLVNGVVAPGAQLFTWVSGSQVPQTTYQDQSTTYPNTNPIILDENGQCNLWIPQGVAYTLCLAPYNDTNPPTNPYWTVNNVIAAASSSSSTSEWIPTGDTGTYISAQQFSVPNNKSATYDVNRRIQCVVNAGNIYGTISGVSYSGGITTVTVTWDAGQLDAGLSNIYVGILDAAHQSTPASLTLNALTVNGNVTIGTTGATTIDNVVTINSDLNVNSAGAIAAQINTNAGVIHIQMLQANVLKGSIQATTAYSLLQTLAAGGNGITVDQAGNLVAAGTVQPLSDKRLKSDLLAIGERHAWEVIDKAAPVSYIKDGRRQVGLIAQDVQRSEIGKLTVTMVDHRGAKGERKRKMRSLDYNGLIAVVVFALFPSIRRRLDDLEARVKTLESLTLPRTPQSNRRS